MTDENGWHVGPLEPWLPTECHSVLAPESGGEFAFERWNHQARKFFGCRVHAAEAKHYANGWPMADAGRLLIEVEASDGIALPVDVRTLPIDRTPDVLVSAREGVVRLGGAGFDALLPRARRVWQFRASEPSAELLASAIIASVTLGPILARDGSIFGVKTARERLARAAAR